MDWPVPFLAESGNEHGAISMRPYSQADAAELFTAPDDERASKHILDCALDAAPARSIA